MEKCIFCDASLSPGGDEHVFLSSLGGRLKTLKAICKSCNNAFANNQTEKVDDELSACFETIRNALCIWTGRDKPPPTILRAGSFENGQEYDLAPGMTPILPRAVIPKLKDLVPGRTHLIAANSVEDAQRVLSILEKRGISANVDATTIVSSKVPEANLKINFNGPKIFRSIAKTAAVAANVLYGNEQVRAKIDCEVRRSIRYAETDISQYIGWDFVNVWPQIYEMTPHASTPKAIASGFEHSVMFVDVGTNWVAYLNLFGEFRFSIRLGSAWGAPPRGLALNPRAMEPSRFVVTPTPPVTYFPRNLQSFKSEFDISSQAVNAALCKVLEKWHIEAGELLAKEATAEVMNAIQAAGDNEDAKKDAVSQWARKFAAIQAGVPWSEPIDLSLDGEDAVR